MIMGTGFPPFRGGLLRYADALGTAVHPGAARRAVVHEPASASVANEPLKRSSPSGTASSIRAHVRS